MKLLSNKINLSLRKLKDKVKISTQQVTENLKSRDFLKKVNNNNQNSKDNSDSWV